MKRNYGHRHASVNIRNDSDKIETVKYNNLIWTVHYVYNILNKQDNKI